MRGKRNSYVPSSGNSFLYNDLEGDGKPRKVHLDITLSEPKPGGGVYSFNVPADLALDPLYDVEISSLIFKLIKGCSNVGANQIDLSWYAPDNSESGKYQTVHFATQEGETFNIQEFNWVRSEVKRGRKLAQNSGMVRRDRYTHWFRPNPRPPDRKSRPGQDSKVQPGVNEFNRLNSGLPGNS